MPTYTVTSKSTSPLISFVVNAASHEAAVAAAITTQAGTGAPPAGSEYSVPSCLSVPPGPTGWNAQTQFIAPATGSTYSAVGTDDAKNQHKAAKGPTGPGANFQILQTF